MKDNKVVGVDDILVELLKVDIEVIFIVMYNFF